MESESEIFSEQFGAKAISGTNATLLRAGSLFACYRIEHDGRYFFFKTFSADTPMARRLLRREYEISSGCDSPYMVRAFLFGPFVEGREGLLMEYVEGRTLSEFIAENPPHHMRRRIFGQLLEAVSALHRKGIIHNDLKSDNILISLRGDTLRLIDFGLSDDDAHFLLKTPGCSGSFAAPELLDGRKSDVRSDIYSIGRIMERLFGRRHRRISSRCRRRNPDNRYRDIEALQKAWRRRHTGKWILGLLLLLLAIVGAGAFYVDRSREYMEKISSLEKAVEAQDAEAERRKAEYDALKSTAESMRDSIARAEAQKNIHEKLKTEALAEFRSGLDSRIRRAEERLKNASTLLEAVNIRQQLVDDIRSYRRSYPDITDGEDIGAALTALMMDKFEESDRTLNRIQAAIDWETMGPEKDKKRH